MLWLSAVRPLPLAPNRAASTAVAAWGVVLGWLVLSPVMGGSGIYLLDWVVGPRTPIAPHSAYGLGGGLQAGVPLALVVGILHHFAGTAATWVPVFLVFPLAAWSIGKLVGGSIMRRAPAAALYCLNPFVFDRIYAGHIGLLIGYAVLPLAVVAVCRDVLGGPRKGVAVGVWTTFLCALTVHFAWIFAIPVAAVAIRRKPLSRTLVWAGIAAMVFGLTSMYLAGPLVNGHSMATAAPSSLDAYRTTSDPTYGLFINVAGLYGFWRQGPTLPKGITSGWVFLLAAIMVVAAMGVRAAWREGGRVRRASIAIGSSGLVGYLLALGTSGPTGALFRWAYLHLPTFAVMRESQKFLVLLALAYAWFFGWGAEHLVAQARSIGPRLATMLVVAVLPVLYTPNLVSGLGGQIKASTLPTDWKSADAVMGRGTGRILFLPWHEYMAYPFTHDRVVASLASESFTRQVIVDDDPGPAFRGETESRRTAFLDHLLSRPPQRDVGRLLAPLGIQYVALAKTVDWRSYSWLSRQSDLSDIFNSSTLEIWRNSDAHPGDVAGRPIRQTSPISYEVSAGPPGWVQLPEPFDVGWRTGGQSPTESAEGNLAFYLNSRATTITFSPWRKIRLLDFLSVIGFAGALTLLSLSGPRAPASVDSCVQSQDE